MNGQQAQLLLWLGETSASALFAGSIGESFIPSFKARMPSPIPLPSSGSFLGPNTSKAMKKITSRCIGWKRPSNIKPPLETTVDFNLTEPELFRQLGCG